MKPNTHAMEAGLLLGVTGLLLLALLAPPLTQHADYHAFADQRTLWGLERAMDVLSNLPFLVAGLAGFTLLSRWPRDALTGVQRACAGLFFAGLVLTFAGSTLYHLRPDDAGLLWDRAGMSIAFAGLLALAAADRVSDRAALALAGTVPVFAALCLWAWQASGNLMPWAVLQGGGMLLVLAFAALRPLPQALGLRLGAVIALYALAKVAESADLAIFGMTGGWLSGHTLKHLIAALAAWPVLAALTRARGPAQSAAAANPKVRIALR